MEDRVILDTIDLVFKEQLAKKLADQYMGPCTMNEVISTNVVKLWLPNLMRIHLVVNISWVIWYNEQVGEQKKEELKGVEEWKVEKILNKRKVRGVIK